MVSSAPFSMILNRPARTHHYKYYCCSNGDDKPRIYTPNLCYYNKINYIIERVITSKQVEIAGDCWCGRDISTIESIF